MKKATPSIGLTGRLRLAIPVAVMLLVFGTTAIVLNAVHRDIGQDRLAEFGRRSDELIRQVDGVVEAQRYLLLGVRSLYEGAGHVGRQEFQGYLDSIDMTNSFPGAYAVNWIPRVPHHILQQYTRSIREDRSIDSAGYPDFQVTPERYAAEHHVVSYLYPMDASKWSFGNDIGASPERLLALEHARDSGSMAATAPLETRIGDTVHKGVLMMLPVYGASKPENLLQRRQFYRGVLAGVVNLDTLMQQTVQDAFTAVSITDISDAAQAGDGVPVSAFYSTGQAVSEAITLYRTTRVGGREWQLAITLSPTAFAQLHDVSLLWFIAAIGVAFGLFFPLAAAKLVALEQRASMSTELLQEELRHTNRDIQGSTGSLKQFAFVTSQGLLTPIQDIDTSVGFLEEALSSRITPQIHENLNYLRQSLVRIRNLADELNDYAGVDRETMRSQFVELEQVFERVQKQLSSHFSDAPMEVRVVGSLPAVMGDPDHLERLLSNLLGNAIDRRSDRRKLSIKVEARRVDDFWEISLVDNGIGIPASQQPYIFAPFQQMNSSAGIADTSLALGICKQIAQCHAGQLYLGSSTDAGTTFVIRLPVADWSASKAA